MISSKGRYALRIMVELAERHAEEFVPLAELARAQDISPGYLARIMAELSKASLVEAVQGKNGGYRLSRQPSDYRVGEILRCGGENTAPVSCLEAGQQACPRRPICRTVGLWERLGDMIQDYLNSVSLQDLMQDPKEEA